MARAVGVNGTSFHPDPVPLYEVTPVIRRARPVPGWARLPRRAGRATVWAVPAYAVAVLVGAGRGGTAAGLAGVLGPVALLSVAGLLAGRVPGWLALAGAGYGAAGGVLLRVSAGA